MRPSVVARNYAETLLALANRGGPGAVDEFDRAMAEVAGILEREPRVREFLETPRVDADAKKHALRASFGGRIPDPLLRFLLVVVDKRRQAILREIAAGYHDLVDQIHGRVRARITLAEPPDDALRTEIVRALEQRLGKEVLPSWETDREMVGGVIVRVADQILDGSVRARLTALRRRLLLTELPEPVHAVNYEL